MRSEQLEQLVRRLADRDSRRSEADVQADVRQLLLTAPLGLDDNQVVALETPVAGRRRIDVEAGYTIVEVKKDLRNWRRLDEAEEQLDDYVKDRTAALGQRYVGVITDGAEWRAYNLRNDELVQVADFIVSYKSPDVRGLLLWLEGVLATTEGVPPTPREVISRLGPRSTSHLLDRASLTALHTDYRNETSVRLKRELWSKMLTTALGTQFQDDDELFVEHTLLVNTAEIIAHALLGFDVTSLQPGTLLSGQRFEQADVLGVVEEDFFDWVLEVPGGESYVRGLARRLSRFDWGAVDHDVLKVLYEAVIGAETRKRLGEYYTPDWLADRIVDRVVSDPLKQRVLDPACGSGTFLFHAVRRFLDAAESEERDLPQSLSSLTGSVIGVDLHPVAVALARVTYLLAIGQDRLLDSSRGPINVPVYLGDSIQWHQRADLFSAEHLIVRTTDDAELFSSELRFPDHLLNDATRFDRLVDDLTALAGKERPDGQVPSLNAVFRRLAIQTEDQPAIEDTFAVLCRLHDDGRDHIWSYYVRNLARPVWLSQPDNRVDVLIGNPPWLAYRHMPDDMQDEFREMSEARGLWHGATVATHQDLSGLFIARSVQRYLVEGGTFGFVMPNAALDRGHYEGFRTGRYADQTEPCGVSFEQPWDLRRLRPHFFPRAASAVFGSRVPTKEATPMPSTAERWSGRLPRQADVWGSVKSEITREEAELTVMSAGEDAMSPYRSRFTQGATLVPRLLFMVEDQPSNPLGTAAGARAIKSARSNYENDPWKSLPPLEGRVENEFIRPAYLGECVLPFRTLPPRETIVPLDGTILMDGANERIDLYPGLAEWWREAESVWEENRKSDNLSLTEQLDYRNKLSAQLPADRQRIVYSASGMHIAAARVTDPHAIIDKSLYWATAATKEEAHYLCAILNGPTTTELVRPYMSYGKDERHIDKFVWYLPIPGYSDSNPVHRRLAELGLAAEEMIGELDIDESKFFPSLRRDIREHLANTEIGREIDGVVRELIA